MNEIYKAPESSISGEQPPLAGAPDYKLFKVPAVGIATFFGTMLAGGIIMSINLRRMGDGAKANQIIAISFFATIAVAVLAVVLPAEVPSMVFTIAQIVTMHQWAKATQEAALAQHVDTGGEMQSNWLAFGMSLLVLLVLAFVSAVLIGMVFPELLY